MALITKPDMEFIWASGGAIVEPSDVKKQTGWTPEVPPHQWENWIQNRQDNYLAHINQRGIPEWDGNTEYEAAGLSYVQGSNGVVYKSVAASGPATTVQDPTTDVSDTYWTIAFAGTAQATEVVAGIAMLATTAEAQAGVNDTDVMTPLKTAQAIALLASSSLDTTRIDVVSAATVNLTVAAPNTRHINITGTTTITAFTVTIGKCYFVRFNAALTLANNANIVTQTGANITTEAGATCIIRATAANVVEVICYMPAGGWENLKAGNGYIDLPSGWTIQQGAVTTSAGGTTVVVFPIGFSTLRSIVAVPVAGGAAYTATIEAISNTQVSVGGWTPSSGARVAINVNWIAIGQSL